MNYKYQHTTVAGTFDHFHKGHQELIKIALRIGAKVSIGIASEKLSQKTVLAETIEALSLRRQTVIDYLKKEPLLSPHRVETTLGLSLQKLHLFSLSDIYGISLTDKTLDSIVVTAETRLNADKINTARRLKGLPPLAIIEIPFILGDDGEVIHSTRIRAGQINRDGHNYSGLFIHKQRLSLPVDMREELRRPLGQVIAGKDDNLIKTAQAARQYIENLKPVFVFTVGDIVTHSFQSIAFPPDVSVIDGKTRRQKLDDRLIEYDLKTENPAGMIFSKAVSLLQSAFVELIYQKQRRRIFIEGEEDLLALPTILLAPLKSVVVYGQWGRGIVVLPVAEEKKEEIERLLQRFE